MSEETRVFFVTESTEDNEELHDTFESAQRYCKSVALLDPNQTTSIRVCIVRNAYQEKMADGTVQWNYEDLADTFETIKELA